jgi:hypothetical protein
MVYGAFMPVIVSTIGQGGSLMDHNLGMVRLQESSLVALYDGLKQTFHGLQLLL